MESPSVHVGVNLYCWDIEAQNRALAASVAPLLGSPEWPPCGFFFDRHDARGPHLMLLWTVPVGKARSFEEALRSSLGDYFSPPPELSGETEEEVFQRHAAARRQPLCPPDRRPGLAAENSFVLFRQEADGFPYLLTDGLETAIAREIWRRWSELCHWTLGQVVASPERRLTGLGLRWLAAFDQALERSMPGAGLELWSYFAGTFWRQLPARLEAEPEEMTDRLEAAVGAGNRQAFDRIWRASAEEEAWPLQGLVNALAAAHRPGAPHAWRLARTIVHITLKQLGMYQMEEAPVLLFVLHRAMLRSQGVVPGVTGLER